VIKLRGVDSIGEAEKLKGAELRIPISDVEPLETGSFYTFELKGCRVYSGDEFLVDREATEILIPFAEAYLKKIDIAGRRIDVDLPEGLRDLNR
jgi:16S rRNA processing protein RimM